MRPTELQLLLTYQCTRECDHCFAWGSPRQHGTMTLERIRLILDQAKELDSLESVSFTGGEPFLQYPILLSAVRRAARDGLKVGVISNGYWATDEAGCTEWLGPLAGLVQDLTISCDWYHWEAELKQHVRNVCTVGRDLNIPVRVVSVIYPECIGIESVTGSVQLEESPLTYRGRAAQELAPDAPGRPWLSFTACQNLDLRNPNRLYIDPFGNVMVCQGISIGNVIDTPLVEICDSYAPEYHPIIGPLLEGGPVELVLRYGLGHESIYADACHACYEARKGLRSKFPDSLASDQMYGVRTTPDPIHTVLAEGDFLR
jgi:hypothetical protein